MTPADRIAHLAIKYGVTVKLHGDGARLDIAGPLGTLNAIAPMLLLHKSELLNYLRATTSPQRTT